MSELNKDGLIPGQPVDMQTILRVNRERKLKQEAEKDGGKKKPAGRKPSKADK